MDILKLRGISLFIVAFCSLVLALVLWQRAEKDKAKIWLGFSAFFTALYAFFCGGTYFFWNADSMASVYWYRTTWLGVFLLPSFIIFTYYFVQNLNYLKIKAFLLYLGAVIISYFALTTDFFVKFVYLKYPNISTLVGKLDFLGRLYIFICVALVLINLFKEYFKSSGFKKLQLQYFILGVAIFFITGIITTAIVPLIIGESPYYDITAYASFVWIGLTATAILKYHFLNIKIIATQFLVFIIWVVALINFITEESFRGHLLTGGSLIFMVIAGILLIKSVIKEVEQREKLEILTKDLQAANEKLIKLDKLKSEFLSFAAHQVKSPMSVVKGYATLILDGTLGLASKKIKDVAQKIKSAANRMIGLVNNLLDSRRIEEGRMEYNFEETNIVDIVKNLVEELRPLADEKKLELSFTTKEKDLRAIIDIQKFSQVIQNLIDNAIKYTSQGWVKVSVTKEDGDILIVVSDSGSGISKDLMLKIFVQFERGTFTDKTMSGTGLGLYIAKQIVLAHKGAIWAESEGDEKGSKFFVKIPAPYK
ncbi:MAG: ATP-binding protein [Patescibacteria group bacterium]